MHWCWRTCPVRGMGETVRPGSRGWQGKSRVARGRDRAARAPSARPGDRRETPHRPSPADRLPGRRPLAGQARPLSTAAPHEARRTERPTDAPMPRRRPPRRPTRPRPRRPREACPTRCASSSSSTRARPGRPTRTSTGSSPCGSTGTCRSGRCWRRCRATPRALLDRRHGPASASPRGCRGMGSQFVEPPARPPPHRGRPLLPRCSPPASRASRGASRSSTSTTRRSTARSRPSSRGRTALLRALGRPGRDAAPQAGRFEAGLGGFERFLDRHLTDEEDLIVPVILRAGGDAA